MGEVKSWLLILSIFIFFTVNTIAQTSSVESVLTLDNSKLSFTIRFENTNADTVHSLVIVDTISSELNMSSFELGVSSHHYDFFFLDKNVVCWHIYDVSIPDKEDSTKNHGFVKYHINHTKKGDIALVKNKPSIYYNYKTNYSIDVNTISALEHHEFIGIETKENVVVEVIDLEDEMVIHDDKKFKDKQVYIEVFDDFGTIEFFAKMNRRDGMNINTSFLKQGNHYLDVYDNHHHELVRKFTK